MAKRRKRTEAEKAERARERMLNKAKEYQTGTYIAKFVSPIFQRMIRAEAADRPAEFAPCIVDGNPSKVFRRVGECVCVTCGKVGPWSGGLAGMHTGHFLASRRHSILFEEDNVAPQCSRCNRYQGGAPQRFRLWMEYVHGILVIENLEYLKTQTRQFTREELVDMRIEYVRRLKDAEASMA